MLGVQAFALLRAFRVRAPLKAEPEGLGLFRV